MPAELLVRREQPQRAGKPQPCAPQSHQGAGGLWPGPPQGRGQLQQEGSEPEVSAQTQSFPQPRHCAGRAAADCPVSRGTAAFVARLAHPRTPGSCCWPAEPFLLQRNTLAMLPPLSCSSLKLKGILGRNQPHRQSGHIVHWTSISQLPVKHKKKINQQWHFKAIIQKGQEIQTNAEELDNINLSLMRRDSMIRLSATLR